MNPAFSVVVFTVAAGAGQGLAVALALALLIGGPIDAPFVRAALEVSIVLLVVGLAASFLHLGRPARAWRAAAMWRTSWLSREVIVLPAFIALVAVWWWMSGDAQSADSLIYFAGIDNARFKRQVVPGDQLILEAEVVRVIRGVGKFRAKASVDGHLACEAELIAAIRPRPAP